jgi:hypothetical protein
MQNNYIKVDIENLIKVLQNTNEKNILLSGTLLLGVSVIASTEKQF